MSSSTVSTSARGATVLILLQVGSRALTFIINQVLLRYLSPELLGVSVQLELYSISVLFFARESIRVALQRQSGDIQAVVNLSYLAIVLGIFLSYLCAIAYLKADLPNVPYLFQSLQIYGVACIIELLSEPAFVAIQHKLLFKIRASAETSATIARCIVTCGVTVLASKLVVDLGVLPFALGQLSYASLLLLVYSYRCWPIASKESFSLWLRKLPESKSDERLLSYFSWPLVTLSGSLWLQSGIKYVLTQGDSLIITAFASLRDQGAYALASNYGGLIARMLFQPIEESSRNLFGRLCAGPTPSEQPAADNISQARDVLQLILKFYSLLSIAAAAVGPTIAPLLLQVVAGSKWIETGAGDVLATYCYYIPLLAVNGVTEAFIAAVATNAELSAQSVYMGGFFAGFAGAAWLFLRVLKFGAQGLVWANCVNMALRIIWGFGFIKSYFGKRSQDFAVVSILPSPFSVAAGVVASTLLRGPKGPFIRYGLLGELARSGGIAGLFVISLAVFERHYLLHCYQLLRPGSVKEVTKKQ